MSQVKGLTHFYIPDEQSIYLLSHADAKKLKDWVALCIDQLASLGYRNISLLGKGAFGFAFAGLATGAIMALVGFVPDTVNSEASITGIRFFYSGLPILGTLGAMSVSYTHLRAHET